MKRYIPIIVGIVALCAVVYVGSGVMKSREDVVTDEQKQAEEVSSKSFQGSVTKEFEGANTLSYGLNLPETATATVSMDGALVKVTEENAPVLAMYISFEGGRGYTPADYITNNIVPKVSAITSMGTTTIGGYDWTVVASANSEWHVASVANGNWLLVVENTKVNTEKAMAILESLSTSVPSTAMTAATDMKKEQAKGTGTMESTGGTEGEQLK